MTTLRQRLEQAHGGQFGRYAVDLDTGKLFTEYREMEGGIALFHDVNQYGDDLTWEVPLDVEPSDDGEYGFQYVKVYRLVEVT
jgi:hypothetical protein